MDSDIIEALFFLAIKYLIISLPFLLVVAILISNKCHFYAKLTALVLGTWLLSAILMFPRCLFRRDYRTALIPAWGVRTFIAFLGNSFEVQDVENIDDKRGGIVLINHQSLLDVSVLSHLWPLVGVLIVVSRKLIMFVYPPSYFFGVLFINRSSGVEAHTIINKQVQAITERNAKIFVFPEGTRHQSDRLLPFKKGPFHLAIQSQSTLWMVVVQRYTFLNRTKKIFGNGHSIIKILPGIDCSGMTVDDLPNLMEMAQTRMQTTYDALNAAAAVKV